MSFHVVAGRHHDHRLGSAGLNGMIHNALQRTGSLKAAEHIIGVSAAAVHQVEHGVPLFGMPVIPIGEIDERVLAQGLVRVIVGEGIVPDSLQMTGLCHGESVWNLFIRKVHGEVSFSIIAVVVCRQQEEAS